MEKASEAPRKHDEEHGGAAAAEGDGRDGGDEEKADEAIPELTPAQRRFEEAQRKRVRTAWKSRRKCAVDVGRGACR